MKKFSRIEYNAPVILTFFILSLGVLILGMLTNGIFIEKFASVYKSSFSDPLIYLRLFTHILGHADLNHFFSNFLIIMILGPMLEEKYGSKLLLQLILITALVTGLINILFFNIAWLGASDVAFMLIILSSFTNVKAKTIPLTFIVVTLLYLSGEVSKTLFSKDDIAHLAHIAGGLCGGIFGLTAKKGMFKMKK
jgi:rhomboid protease GluP